MFTGYTRSIITFVCLMLFSLVTVPDASGASSGTVEGTVRDGQTGDPLPGANVMILKTSLGASTDMDGKFIIRNVPAGSHSLRAAYVGYLQKVVTIMVKEEGVLRQDFKLSAVGVEGQEVVVTAQAAGQKEAINQQLSAMPIMNVVSAARIQELPDVNAAESVGRLPGLPDPDGWGGGAGRYPRPFAAVQSDHH